MPGEDGEAGAGPGRRLIITHMTLENFKSYAGIQHIGPFHKRFSSVVGPNGSGKSNVIDAMLFVFGKKAKQLRLNKVSELIHKSENNMDLTSCKVSVHFVEILDKNVDGEEYEVIPGSELKVCRVATSDNQSLYYVNDKSSKFAEVAALLTSKGIDLDHNRFLILQGEVELISLMPPKAKTEHETGMLEYLEDIIGSNRLVKEIENSGKEVDAMNEERGQKVTKLKIVEKDRNNLEGAKAEAEEYVRQQRSLLQREGIKCQLEKAKMMEQGEGMLSEKANVDGKLESERAKLAAAKAAVDNMTESYQKEKEDYELVQTELQRTMDEFAVFERKDIKHKEDVKHLKAKEKKLLENAKKEREKAEKAREAIPKQEKAIKECEETVAKMEKQIPREQEILDALYEGAKAETKALRVSLDAAHKELEPWADKTSEAQSAFDLASSELKLMNDRGNKAKDALAMAKKKLADAEPSKKAKQGELKTKQAALGKVKKQLEDGKEELESLKMNEQALRGDIASSRSKLEESKAASSSSKSQSQVAKVLNDAAKAGKINGFYGRLGDLGTIDDKYDVAITTACGALNNMVVDTTNTAQACCELLRKTGAGVATFLILDKQTSLKISDKANFSAPRLFDLVKPVDDKFLPAFYFALRDTLVAQDLDSATKLAYSGPKRNRVVTLAGAVIDTSGTMSGGGNRVQKGGMSSKSSVSSEGALSEKELIALEKSLAKQCDELTATRAKTQQADKAIAQWSREVEELCVAVQRLELELSALSKEQAELSANMSVYEAEAKAGPSDKSKVKELEEALALNEKALAKAKSKSDVLESKCKELQQQIMDAGGQKLKMQKTKVDGMQKALEEATANISKNKVAVKSAAKTIEKAEAAAIEADEEAVAAKQALQKTKAEFVEIESAALVVMEAYKNAQKAQEEKQVALKKIESEYERVRKEAGKLRADQVDLEERAAELTKAVKEYEAKAKAYDSEWDQIKNKYMKDDFIISLDENEAAAGGVIAEGEDAVEKKEAKGGSGSIMTGFVRLEEEALAKHSLKDCSYNINLLKESIARISPNMGAIAEYRTKEAEWRERQKELDEVTEKRDVVRAHHDVLRKQRLDEFMAGFSVITMRLKEMYQMITLGGDAELELVDSLDPFSEGIVFSVRPPKKSWKNISNLSGGEKTLSSLSLVFALHHYKPTPLYVMDEIDAALDFKNVSIVANYIKERTKNAQFIIISLRNNMFELADRLVGIYKTHHCTKSVTINPAKLAAHLPAAAKENMVPTA